MNNNLLSEGKRILHFAPERIIERNIKRVRGIEYISADINKHIADEIVDIQNIHYPDSYFDLIICSHVLAHVEDEKKSLEEMYRVLRKGGLAIIMTKIDKNLIKTLEIKDVDSREMVEYFRKMEIYRIHSIDFAEIIKNVGFSVDVVDYVSVVGEAIANYHAFSSNDLLYLCYK